ncbi:MAG TPA: transposase family protein [Euzebyales bacterium]|nr:transposase family protein [Euzebyales bacterium]
MTWPTARGSPGSKALLSAFLDDHSRLVVGHRWGRSEDVLRLEAALRRGLASRGVPKRIYVDNGSPFISHQLQRACAVLGIRLVHSRPGRPARDADRIRHDDVHRRVTSEVARRSTVSPSAWATRSAIRRSTISTMRGRNAMLAAL